jgi:hypothetical protein
MNSVSSRALTIARPTVQVLTMLNLLYAAGISCLLAYSLVDANGMSPLGDEWMAWRFPNATIGFQILIGLGIAGAAIVHVVLRRLLAIVDTVRAGNPFNLDNARRLEAIGWGVMALELLRLGAWKLLSSTFVAGKFGGFALTPWLAVLLLFVLAGVFKQGARMRDDLEGTV